MVTINEDDTLAKILISAASNIIQEGAPVYEERVTKDGTRILVLTEIIAPVTPAALTAATAALNSKIVQRYLAEQRANKAINVGDKLEELKNQKMIKEISND